MCVITFLRANLSNTRLNEMISLTEKPCRFTLAGLFSFSAEDLS
jgi:hypothetical protein